MKDAKSPRPRGRPPTPLPVPFSICERQLVVYGRGGLRGEQTMYVPAIWPVEASHPAFFPASRRTPYSGYPDGARRYRMFSRRTAAAAWLRDNHAALLALNGPHASHDSQVDPAATTPAMAAVTTGEAEVTP